MRLSKALVNITIALCLIFLCSGCAGQSKPRTEESSPAETETPASTPKSTETAAATEAPETTLIPAASLLAGTVWKWNGFRLSDSAEYHFADDSTVRVTSLTGGDPWDGSYQFDGEKLTIFNEDKTVFDELIYNESSRSFTSILRKTLAEQDYMDENGVYHEPKYIYGTMTRSETSAEPQIPDGNISDIKNLREIVDCYASCVNGRFCVEYDSGKPLPGSFDGIDYYYPVTAPSGSTTELRQYLQTFLTPELLAELWTENCFRETGGQLYYRPGNAGYISYNADKAILQKTDENGSYYAAIPMYNSGGVYTNTEVFVFKSTEDGFRLKKVN